jgi:hypothetical protein
LTCRSKTNTLIVPEKSALTVELKIIALLPTLFSAATMMNRLASLVKR